MALFPSVSSIPYKNPFEGEMEWKTAITGLQGGKEQRLQRRLFVRRNGTLVYEHLSLTDAQTLYAFFLARAGAFGGFNFFYPFSAAYLTEYVGTGDGSTTVFNLPSTSAASYTLYKNGSALTAGGVHWTFGAAAGTDGADKATLVTAPANGDYLTFSFTGYLKVRCRFAEDTMGFQEFYNRLVTLGVKLKGLLNE